MKNRDKSKRYEFVKLCNALTKQGFQFTRYKDTYLLVFDKIEVKRLLSPFTKLPFVNSIGSIGCSDVYICNKRKFIIEFKQWSD